MKTRALFVISLVLFLVGAYPAPVLADGIIVPNPPICLPERCPPPPPHPIRIDSLAVKYHHVTVKIENQVAVTHVDQVFSNPNDFAIEGDYFFPLPAEAAVSNFILWVDGKPVQGQVLDAAQAREKYEEIVRSQRDPALLEYSSRGAVEAHIFPIPPDGERRVELEYSQALPADNGLVRYVYPLNTEKFSALPLGDVSISVQIASTQPIRAVYSPTHTVAVDRPDDQHANASYEATNVKPDTDFALYYSTGESEAFHLLSYRDPTDPADPDGFFLVLLAPKPDVSTQPVAKDVLLVLDHSGSMDGEKFRQVQQAAGYILDHLNASDRFDIVTFSSNVQSYAPSLRLASEAPAAKAWIGQIDAQGSTDINRALLEAAGMADVERPTYLIFLTDGLPTVGEMDTQKILQNFSAAAHPNLRLFSFGVGYDVDTTLLDSLAQQNHGASTYVRPGEALDEIISSFYAKITTPVLTNLNLQISGTSTYDLYPNPLPDLFLGSQIVVVGRYQSGGPVEITLTGDVNGQKQTFHYTDLALDRQTSDASASLSALPRLWATRKIGYLLSKIRLNGPDQETIDQIVHLSIRYGIVTPYTSYLVTEPLPLGQESQSRIAQNQFQSLQQAPAAAPSGQAAVNKSADESALAGAEAPVQASAGGQDTIRTAGSRTFVLTDGTWTDTAYDPQKTSKVPVAFLSPDYFALAQSSPDLAAALALGEKVIVVSGQKAYEVVAEGQPAAPLQVPTQAATAMPAAPVSTLAPISTNSAVPVSTPAASNPTAEPEASHPTLPSPLWLGLLIPAALAVYLFRRR